jgi:hypothetical protein
MGRIVYVKVINSCKPAHQYVNFDSERIGEIWREQVDTVDTKGRPVKKWRWFAFQSGWPAHPEGMDALSYKAGYGSKDKAVDALELLAKPVSVAEPAVSDLGQHLA